MSFQKINQVDTETQQGRECILVYGFVGKDFIKLKNLCNMIGMRDIVQVDKDMVEEKLQNIIDGNIIKAKSEPLLTERAIVLNAFSGQKLHTFLENFKRTGIKRPLIATVTPTSITWTFRELIEELQKEREAIVKMNQLAHENSEE